MTSGNEPRWTRVAALAARQHGVLSSEHLHQLGFSDDEISRAARSGGLHRMHRGVYVVGHTALAPLAREQAALLACGGGDAAVLSHASAAALWKLGTRPPLVDVTVIGRRVRARRGIRLHVLERIEPDEVSDRHGLKLTSPARTILDLAALDCGDGVEAALSEAYALKLITEPMIRRTLERHRGRPGAGGLRALLASQEGPVITKSRAERMLRALLRKAGLPQPVSNARLLGYSPDLLWAEQRLIVEFDGFQWHGHRAKFESDRERDAIFVAHGYRVIRITWRQLVNHPYRVLANLARALGS